MNDINLLVCGEEAFKCIIENIKKAKSTININMFIWRDDYIGNLIADELLVAANRGVKIYISKDKIGSMFEYGEENRQSFFNKDYNLLLFLEGYLLNFSYPMKGKNKSQKQKKNSKVNNLVNHKNITASYEISKNDHSKYYIFDDEILIMGGINIEDKELTFDVEKRKYFDYMVEFKGLKYVEIFNNQLSKANEVDFKNEINFIFNVINNNKKHFEVKNQILNLLDKAEQSICIVMAYLGDLDFENKIVELANNNTKVTIITSKKSNLQQDLNMKILKRIMKRTNGKVNIYLSENMVHAKLIKIDNEYVTIGSTNLNSSIDKLQELNTVIKLNNDDFNNKLNESIENQIRSSIQICNLNQIKYGKIKVFFEDII
ncbi:phosphatidylserine/phosphatidylglycerophosphate/cardiolipin synthase family protein [Clostridiaceae bacterium HSG29]|nr:phosphatidylserine/phosphatidylglycerophosphate/cardiolipin synthase family protein [Clostridiaceae bacterium HSG29]